MNNICLLGLFVVYDVYVLFSWSRGGVLSKSFDLLNLLQCVPAWSIRICHQTKRPATLYARCWQSFVSFALLVNIWFGRSEKSTDLAGVHRAECSKMCSS